MGLDDSDHRRHHHYFRIITSILIIGVIFVVLTFLAGSVQPDYTKIDPNSGFLDILGIVGGKPLQLYASIVVVLSFSLASGEECITSVSRILYAVGRDGILPRRFGKLNDKTHTPVVAPLIGTGVSVWIFTGLGPLAWSVGTVWLVVGLIIIAIRPGFFRKKLGASENLQEYFA